MIVYLAGEIYGVDTFKSVNFEFNRLDSFIYVDKSAEYKAFIGGYNRYMLDSGAFTFIMSKKKVSVDIDSYTDRYVEFINHYKIDLFFEMDVDND